MTYESLIFDIDGTLWDSRALVAAGYNAQLEKEGLSHLCVTVEILTGLFGKTTEEIGQILFASFPQPERLPLIKRCMQSEQAYLERNASKEMAYPKVVETVRALCRKHRLFIVSNCEDGYPQRCMEALGLTDCFAGTLCHGQTGTGKGQTILTLMKQFHVENCVYIGDTQGDYEATLEAGIPFIWASYGFGTPAGYDAKINSIDELLKM